MCEPTADRLFSMPVGDRREDIMLKDLKKHLKAANGRSEFIVAVACDIRGFSAFSTVHESPDIAMFIKRFYLRLLDEYFTTASFAKPTGDGLLMVFRYSETTLHEVVKLVLNTCLKATADFPMMFGQDPMINFATPANLGFGIARGTACCLFSGNRVLDYSGQLLNLTARLNDLARPRGVVIDGAFQEEVIPEELRKTFVQRRAYIRSIAEENSREILCSQDVTLPTYSQAPLSSHEWACARHETTVANLGKILGSIRIPLASEPLTMEKTKLEFAWPSQKIKGNRSWRPYDAYECNSDAKGHWLRFSVGPAKAIAAEESLPPRTKVAFVFHYVPKPKGKRRT